MATASNVSTGKPKVGGAIYCAPTGTTLPTSATTTLATAYKNLGYISEDGVKNNNSPTRQTFKAWGGDTVLSTQTDKEDTFGFKLIEVLNTDVLAAVYGSGNVSGSLSAGIVVKANTSEQSALCWVIDMVLNGGILKRIVIPSAAVSAVAEIVYADGSLTGYDTTITATADSSGNTHYEYIQQPKTST